jgi:O-antigen ligase
MLTWQGAWETFLNFPIFGKGIGLGVTAVQFLAPSGQMQLLTDAHNTWLSVAAQAGVMGLTSLLMLSIAIIYRGVPASDPTDALSPVRSALLIAFISSFIIQGFVGSFEDARHLWVLVGLIIASSRLARNHDKVS